MERLKGKTLADVGINDAFGFVTILAALEGVRETLAVEIQQVDLISVLLFAYFLIFRMKMYLDDSAHQFEWKGFLGILDVVVAFSSWVAFLVSAAAIGTNSKAAIEWFVLGLAISLIWIVVASLRSGGDPDHRYRWFAFFNIVHIAALLILRANLNVMNALAILGLLLLFIFWDYSTSKD